MPVTHAKIFCAASIAACDSVEDVQFFFLRGAEDASAEESYPAANSLLPVS